MSRFDLRSNLVEVAKNDVVQPFRVKAGKKTAGSFRLSGKSAALAQKWSSVKKAIEDENELVISLAGEVIAGTDGKLHSGATSVLIDSEDAICALEEYFKAEEKPAKEKAGGRLANNGQAAPAIAPAGK